MASLFVDDHPSTVKLNMFLHGNCFLIASTVTMYSIEQMLLSMVVDTSTNSLLNALYHHSSSTFNIAFHCIWAEMNLNIRYRFQVSWWNSAISKSFITSLVHIVCQFSPYKQFLIVKYQFSQRTYNWNSPTSLPLQYEKTLFIDCWISQLGNC